MESWRDFDMNPYKIKAVKESLVSNSPPAKPQNPEERQEIQNMLMRAIAIYLEDHPEIEAGKNKVKK